MTAKWKKTKGKLQIPDQYTDTLPGFDFLSELDQMCRQAKLAGSIDHPSELIAPVLLIGGNKFYDVLFAYAFDRNSRVFYGMEILRHEYVAFGYYKEEFLIREAPRVKPTLELQTRNFHDLGSIWWGFEAAALSLPESAYSGKKCEAFFNKEAMDETKRWLRERGETT